jgi:hypothetical protein
MIIIMASAKLSVSSQKRWGNNDTVYVPRVHDTPTPVKLIRGKAEAFPAADRVY